MLRGMSTINLWAEDLSAATRWYTELLGANRITLARPPGAGQATSSSASATASTNWASSTGDLLPRSLPQALAGRSCAGRSTTLPHPLDRLVSLGAKLLEPITEQGGPGYVTASVVDPFGNVLGIMYNRHYLDILGDRGGAQ